ncbi:MAG TPA: hypothetical protein VHG33_10565, partial [Woeseiaceae bacterium]|nr:hypothetical protein [Woeseiaceae bacterium]
FRNRFWALLASHPRAEWRYTVQPQSGSVWEAGIHAGERLVIYAGPTAPEILRAVDPALSQIMFEDMWFWMRWLCLAFLYVLNANALLLDGSWGIAIIALSAIVKVMMEPRVTMQALPLGIIKMAGDVRQAVYDRPPAS